jgi:hypothetical protein
MIYTYIYIIINCIRPIRHWFSVSESLPTQLCLTCNHNELQEHCVSTT